MGKIVRSFECSLFISRSKACREQTKCCFKCPSLTTCIQTYISYNFNLDSFECSDTPCGKRCSALTYFDRLDMFLLQSGKLKINIKYTPNIHNNGSCLREKLK